MDNKKKDLLTTVGGVLVVGAVTFGGALLLLGSRSSAPVSGHEEAKAGEHGSEGEHGEASQAHDAKSTEHGEAKSNESGHGEAKSKEASHGEAKPKADPHGEAKSKESAHGEAKPKDGHGEASEGGHGASKSKGDTHGLAHESTDPDAPKLMRVANEEPKEEGHGKSEGKGGHGEAKAEVKKGPIEPLSLDELTAKADALLSRGRPDDAIDFYSRANKVGLKGPMAARTLKRWADAYLQSNVLPLQRRNEKAMELFSRILTDFPEFEGTQTTLLDLGDCQRNMGKWEEAYDTFGQYAERFPKGEGYFYSRMNQVDALLALDRAQDAVELLNKKISPTGLDSDRRAVLLAKTATAKLQLARDGQLPATTSQKAEVVGTAVFSGNGKAVIEEAKESVAPVVPVTKPVQPKHSEEAPAKHGEPEKLAEPKHSEAEQPNTHKEIAAEKDETPAPHAEALKEAHANAPAHDNAPATKLQAPVRPTAAAQDKVPAPIRKAALEASQPKVSEKELEKKPVEPAPVHEVPETKNPGAAKSLIPAGQLDAVKKAIGLGQIREARRLMQPFLENDDLDPQLTAELWMEWARLLNDHMSTLKTNKATADASGSEERR